MPTPTKANRSAFHRVTAPLFILVGALGTPFEVDAQSVTNFYGLLDAGVRVDSKAPQAPPGGASTLTSLGSGILNASRWGLKGSENLGNDLKASFNLESGFSATTGAALDRASLFERRATLGLAGDWGRLDLGRNTTFGYDVAAGYVLDPLGQELSSRKQGTLNKIWNINPLTTLYSGHATTIRRDNAIKYLGQFGDVSLGLAYALGAGSSSANASLQALVRYTVRGLDAATTYDDLTDSTATKHLKTYSLGGNYDFSGLKLTLGYTEQRADAGFVTSSGVLAGATPTPIYAYVYGATSATQGVKLSVADVGLAYDLTPALNVVGAYYQTLLSADGINSTKLNTYVIRARYALSKTTGLYAELDQSNSGGIAATHTSAQATSDTGFAAGLQVRF